MSHPRAPLIENAVVGVPVNPNITVIRIPQAIPRILIVPSDAPFADLNFPSVPTHTPGGKVVTSNNNPPLDPPLSDMNFPSAPTYAPGKLADLTFPSAPTHTPGKHDEVIKKIDDELVAYLNYLEEQFVRRNLFRDSAWNNQPKHKVIFEKTGALTWEKRASTKIDKNAIYQFDDNIKKIDNKPFSQQFKTDNNLSVMFINPFKADPYEEQLKTDLVKKFNAVQHLRAVLKNPINSGITNLQMLYQELCLPGSPLLKHRSTSINHALFRDAYWKRMLLNIAAILTVVPGIVLAINSKFFTPKSSWNFTAFKGDIVVQNIKQAARAFLKKS